jgi:cell fate (sporulation/competence/biofilm development) regulator YlbF (YheA/YmcA/DUF963 family)
MTRRNYGGKMLNHKELNDLEIASPSVVRQAAYDFAAALVDTPQYAKFVAASERLNKDAEAQQAMQAFQEKQLSLQMLLQLNAVGLEDRAELERLSQAFLSKPSVQAYFEAQAGLTSICQAAAELISQSIGLNYSAICGSSCCG